MCGQARIQGIESFWPILKRGHVGVYHKMSPKHLDRYVAESTNRHNMRESDIILLMGAMIAGMRGKRLRYEDLIAPNGLSSGAHRKN